MTDYLESVKDLVRQYDVRIDAIPKDQPENSNRLVELRDAISGLINEVVDLRAVTQPIPLFNGEDISDLPADLIKELNFTKADEIEEKLFTIINAAGGEADIDTILVALYLSLIHI